MASVAGGKLQFAGHVALRPAVQVAQDDRNPVLVRQPGQFRVEDRLQVGPGLVGGDGRVRHGVHLLLLCLPAGGRPAGLEGGPVRDSVEPVPDQVPRTDRGGPPGQDEEGGLEGVLGQVRVADHAAADAQDHRPVPADQGGEGRLVVRRRRRTRDSWPSPVVGVAGQHDAAQVRQQALGRRIGRHGLGSREGRRLPICYCPTRGSALQSRSHFVRRPTRNTGLTSLWYRWLGRGYP